MGGCSTSVGHPGTCEQAPFSSSFIKSFAGHILPVELQKSVLGIHSCVKMSEIIPFSFRINNCSANHRRCCLCVLLPVCTRVQVCGWVLKDGGILPLQLTRGSENLFCIPSQLVTRAVTLSVTSWRVPLRQLWSGCRDEPTTSVSIQRESVGHTLARGHHIAFPAHRFNFQKAT